MKRLESSEGTWWQANSRCIKKIWKTYEMKMEGNESNVQVLTCRPRELDLIDVTHKQVHHSYRVFTHTQAPYAYGINPKVTCGTLSYKYT